MGLISFGPIQTSPTSLQVHVSKLAFAETLTHHFHCTVLKVANTNNTPHLQFFSNSKFKSTLCLFCLGISLPPQLFFFLILFSIFHFISSLQPFFPFFPFPSNFLTFTEAPICLGKVLS
jgi:hypothetical protein